MVVGKGRTVAAGAAGSRVTVARPAGLWVLLLGAGVAAALGAYAGLHEPALPLAQLPDFDFELLEILLRQTSVCSKRLLVNNTPQANILQRAYTQQRRIACIANTRYSRPNSFTRTPRSRNVNVIRRHPFQTRGRQLSQPRKKVVLFFFEITAQSSQFEMSVSIDQAWKDDGVAERFDLRCRKLRNDLTGRTNAGNPLSRNCNRTIFNRCG